MVVLNVAHNRKREYCSFVEEDDLGNEVKVFQRRKHENEARTWLVLLPEREATKGGIPRLTCDLENTRLHWIVHSL